MTSGPVEMMCDSFENTERIIGVSQRYPELSILYNASFGSNNVRLDVRLAQP